MIFYFLNVPGQNKEILFAVSLLLKMYTTGLITLNLVYSQIKIGILESEICFPVFLKQY